MSYARAIANNDVVLLAWDPGLPIKDCLGYDIRRREIGKRRRSLPAWVGFSGDDPKTAPRTTLQWPVQKFNWRDLTAQAGATYIYEIVPMIGTPGALKRSSTVLTTNPVTVTPQCSEHVRAFFNRGILATQHLSKLLTGMGNGQLPDFADPTDPVLVELRRRLSTPGDSIRLGLADQILVGVTALLDRAKADGGHCFASLYELADPELVDALTGPHVTVVLSNAGDGPLRDNTNTAARDALHAAGVDVTDRMLGSGHIGHNKFVVYCDPAGAARAVLTGSTNWTSTGLCTQSNNALIVDDDAVAAAYLDYWHAIRAESPAPRATQAAAFRTENRQPLPAAPVDTGTVTLWRSPNTVRQSKPALDPPRPVDLAEVYALIAAATQGAVFLLFQPGRPSVLDALLDAQTANPELFVRGAATDIDAIGDYGTELFHRNGNVAHVAAASAIKDDFAFWQRELLKLPGAHAIVHDKILVLDPFSATDCVVVTGSHNLGYRASYNNDDNFVVVRGNPGLAAAYTTHVLDVYDHYRWRYTLQSNGQQAWTGLSRESKWQNKYFAGVIKEEFRFFGG